MSKAVFLLLFLTISQKLLCSSSAVIELEQKDAFVDYLPQHLGSHFKPGVIFKQQKYNAEGELKQVDSIAFSKRKHTPKFPDDLIDVNKTTYETFSEFLKDTNINVRFVKNVKHILPFLVSKKYLYEDETLDDIETLSYDGVVTSDSISVIRQIMNVVNGNDVYIQGLTYKGNDLVTNTTMKFDTSNQKQVFAFLLRDISLTQLINIMGVFKQAVTAYTDELQVASFVSDTLDLLYPNYDWAVVVDVIGSLHDIHRKEEVKYVVMFHEETMYTIYTLPPI